jgi:SAM-dependent MidA family methyltransferase
MANPHRTPDPSPNLAVQAIAHRICQTPQQRITFAEYMELALYHPQHGYYAAQNTIIGPKGDFLTSPHLGHDFGELLAEQFAQMWEILGQPSKFTLLEMGAGQGLIAWDVLTYLEKTHPSCFAALTYQMVEKSPALRQAQQTHLAPWATKLAWTDLDRIPPNTLVGCCFSNELVDALPVHQVILTESGLQEIYVTLAPDGETSKARSPENFPENSPENSPENCLNPVPQKSPEEFRENSPAFPQASSPAHDFQEIMGDLSTPQLADYFEFVDIDLKSPQYASGYRTEVNLAALTWMEQVATVLQRGFVLTIDYGYPAQQYYSPQRSQGTLQCYYQHAHHNDPYCYIGQQDITAHVDFTALERQGTRCGLTTVGQTQQAMFLMALGLGDRLAALANEADGPNSLQTVIRRRDALHQLMNPMGLGNFGVLLQSKGLTATAAQIPLKGLTIPPMG